MTNTKPVKRGRPPKLDTFSEALTPVRATLEKNAIYKEAAASEGLSLSMRLKTAAKEKLSIKQAPKEK